MHDICEGEEVIFYLYALIAGACAVVLEMIFRRTALPYWQTLWFVIPLQVVIGYCVFEIFTRAGSLLAGAVVFSMGTVSMRLVAGFLILGESPPLKTLIAFGLIVAAQVVRFIPVK